MAASADGPPRARPIARRLKWALLAAGVVVAAVAALAHWSFSDRGRLTTEPVSTGLARSVSGNDLVSPRDPAVTLRFAPGFRHLGGHKFVLYGVADAEQHFFVQTHADGRLRSVYWVQFEAFLPDVPQAYDYEHSPLRLRLGEFAFYADAAVGEFDPAKKRSRGTDGAMARRLLAGHGLALPRDYAYARLVHLTDATRRKELMIIFIEDLAPLGLTAAALQDGGPEAARRAAVQQRHLDRIAETLSLLPPQRAP